MPTKGEYTYYKVQANCIKTNFSDIYPTWQVWRDSKLIFKNVNAMPPFVDKDKAASPILEREQPRGGQLA
eukprot:8621813-Pyramimonas_sp.AAC.1